MPDSIAAMKRVVIAGVSGCGKSTVGHLVAGMLECEFLDADDFHPPANVAKMRSGTPLEDSDRVGWYETLGRELAARERVVMACSALKRAYRDWLRSAAGGLEFVLLEADPEWIRGKMRARADSGGHFMPPALLDSQLATLEKGDDLVPVENSGSPEEVAERVRVAVGGY